MPGPVADADGLIAQLRAENATLHEEIQGLRAMIAQLQERIRELEARANQNSRNSSRPPSSDLPGVPPRPGRQRSGRQRGGQPGHPGHRCTPVPRDQVDRFVECWPTQCRHCHHPLPEVDARIELGPAVPYQVQDVRIVREVTQYEQHRVQCPHCGRGTLGSLPAEVVHSQYGPGLTAMVAMCSGVFQLARREVARFCHEACGVPVSVGSVQKMCEEFSAGLAAPVQELTEAIRQQAGVGMDETGWRDRFRRRYLWRVGCALGSVFKIGTRAAAVGKGLLGATFAGCVMTDRYAGYDWLPAKRRQVCWAHLARDGQGLVELGKAAAEYGRAIRNAAKAVSRLWRDFKRAGGGPQARSALQASLQPVKKKLQPVLERGCGSRTKKVFNLCTAMLKGWDSLWLFSVQDGMEPTNNASERDLRRAVLWRRRSLGTHSDNGAAFVERMLSVSSTCRRQGRSPLVYLTEVAYALRSGQLVPSLLPETPPQPARDEPPWAAISLAGPEVTASPPALGLTQPAGLPTTPTSSGAAIARPAASAAGQRPPHRWAQGHPLIPLGASP